MTSKQMRQFKLGILLLIVAAMFGGCAEERDPVDRVQPYAIDKSFFIGENYADTRDDPEFWGRNSLVDVGYGASQGYLFTATFTQSVARMKWQVTEDYLIGRATYERIAGSDGKGAPKIDKYGTAVGSETNDGVITAMFRIEKHFDIVKSYNPTTGEKVNVVEENSWDRPWYERQYMRVDWSSNMNTDSYDFDTLGLLGVYGSTIYEPVSYFIEDPNDPEAPFFDMETGYFDVTTKAFAKPQLINLSHLGWGIDSFPSCMLPNDFFGGTAPIGSCNPVELTLRHSFRRVVDSDFQTREWDGPKFTTFGGFYTERYGYSRNYRVTDAQWHRILNYYQIWERSHYYEDYETMDGWIPCNTDETTPYGADPNRDLNGDGTADECKTVADGVDQDGNAIEGGSQCNTFKQRCTLPYQSRKAKPMAWHFTKGGDMNYFEPTALATHEWDVALRSAVQTAKYAECRRIGKNKGTCSDDYPVWFGQMDETQDAINLALEVDDCRIGLTHPEITDREECKGLADSIGDDRKYTKGVIATAKMDEMIVFCHGPVRFDDPELCGYPRLPIGMDEETCLVATNTIDEDGIDSNSDFGQLYDTVLDDDNEISNLEELTAACRNAISARAGDLRYHQVNLVESPATPSPWGIMTSAVDPTTGETFSTSANVWTWVNDYWAQLVVDEMRLTAGDLAVSDITEAKNVKDWATASEAAASGGAFGQLSRKQVSGIMSQFVTGIEDESFLDTRPKGLPGEETLSPELQDYVASLNSIQASLDAPSAYSAIYEARRRQARGTEFEAELMTQAVKEIAGVDTFTMSDSILDVASPLRGGNLDMQRRFEMMRQNALGKRGVCIMEASSAQVPLAMTGLTDLIEEKFGPLVNDKEDTEAHQARMDKIVKYIGKKAHFAVVTHEMGHSISHRHNFVSSSDAWSYRPQYWQLRTNDGTVTEVCDGQNTNGEDCVGPRYFDPLTENEKKNIIQMWMNSSVMDYAGEPTQDFLGIGAYDIAAARMFYGDVVSVHADQRYNLDGDRGPGTLNKIGGGFGGITGISHYWGGQQIHYSELNGKYDLIYDCAGVDPMKFKPARYDSEVSGKFNPLLDALIVNPEGRGHTRCKQQRVDYVQWDDLRMPESGEYSGYYGRFRSIDSKDRVAVPYNFATDGWADIGNASVYRHDNGADVYEIFNFMISQLEAQHIFDTYRRGNAAFSIRSAASRALGRYNAKVRDGIKGLGLYRNLVEDLALSDGINPSTRWETLVRDNGMMFDQPIVAASMVFDHFTNELFRPESGPHHRTDPDDVTGVLRSSNDTGLAPSGNVVAVIPDGAMGTPYGNLTPGGALIENTMADGLGDYDRDYTMNAGSYYNKMYVSMLLTESADNFISDSLLDFVDPRYRSVSVADLFPDGYRRVLGNALTGDDMLKGPRIAASSKGVPILDDRQMIDHPIGWTSWWGDAPKTCFPSEGTRVCEVFAHDEWDSKGDEPGYTIPVDPQVGWEQQKFLIAWTMLFLPENQKFGWTNMMRMWELGKDADPGFENRIELHHPSGKTFVAHTMGRETIFGKEVQKGVAARVLEWGNELLNKAYVTVEVDNNGDGKTDWYEPVLSEESGEYLVRFDETVAPADTTNCNDLRSWGCTCQDNRHCIYLERYVSVPAYMRQALDAYGLADPEPKGIYD